MACEFSDLIEQTNGHVYFSPDAGHIAMAAGSRIYVRDSHTLAITNIFVCLDRAEKIEWSRDSAYILCGMYTRSTVQVFSLADADWKCKINEGIGGLVSAKWTPDSRHIITESDFGIQLTVWSLFDGTSMLIANPKQVIGEKGSSGMMIAFSDCDRFLAVGHRIDLQDFISVISMDVGEWTELSKFKCKGGGNDLVSLQWTPNGAFIVAVDSHLQYKLCVYTPSGELVTAYEAYQNALGNFLKYSILF